MYRRIGHHTGGVSGKHQAQVLKTMRLRKEPGLHKYRLEAKSRHRRSSSFHRIARIVVMRITG
jgi:hypothetical protein